MKLVKMSLVAAMLVASASAIDNIKIDGDAKVYYGTYKVKGDSSTGFLKQDSSFADTALRFGVTADLLSNLSLGATAYAVSTLGLENNLVSDTWTSGHSDFVEDNAWMGELWLASKLGNTTAKIGRMELDTPLAFSEKWNIVPNTFDAAVLINQDVPDTTLVAAWVGKGNGGSGTIGQGVVVDDAKFSSFSPVGKGAYAFGAVNNSFKPLTLQGWYYNVLQAADAFWLQGDLACKLVPGLYAGAQYAQVKPKGIVKNGLGVRDTAKVFAVKAGYGIDGLNAYAAYSKAKDENALPVANVATSFGQSKLYTEFYFFGNYGEVGAPDAKTFKLAADYDTKDFGKYLVSYTQLKNKSLANNKVKELALEGSDTFGPLNASLAYVYTEDKDDFSGKDKFHALIAKLQLNF